MPVFSLLQWWYGAGWLALARRVWGRVGSMLEFFSVWQLLGSLFAPFRQISASGGRADGPLQAQLAAWGDKQFSRVMGAVIRSMLIIIGLVSAAFLAVFGLAMLLTWTLIPVAPLVGLVVMLAGVQLV